MKKINVRVTYGFVLFGAFLCLLPSVGAQVDCDRHHPGVLQRAIDRARPGDTLLVMGTCSENVTIPEGKDRITLDGGGKAIIYGPDATQDTLSVRGRGITIKGFTITGGQEGIEIRDGGSAVIDGNTIESTGRRGIEVRRLSSAVIVNNTVRNNPAIGIVVAGSSVAFIGVRTSEDTVASPNIIQNNNGFAGINVTYSSTGRIVGNAISNNGRSGVRVDRASHADICDNIIDGNGENGIHVSSGSGVNLGTDTGDGIFQRPNRTKSRNNDFGIQCEVGGYANGRLGSLMGARGAESYSEGCVNSLIR